MNYNIIYPFIKVINGDSLSEAIKSYVKLNYNIKLTNLIIQDQNKYFDTKLKYYMHDNRNKVGIDIYPTNSLLIKNMIKSMQSPQKIQIPIQQTIPIQQSLSLFI
jgi:hypothetical protein